VIRAEPRPAAPPPHLNHRRAGVNDSGGENHIGAITMRAPSGLRERPYHFAAKTAAPRARIRGDRRAPPTSDWSNRRVNADG
jgi:hypothetical protein